jgi:hypothetical protein
MKFKRKNPSVIYFLQKIIPFTITTKQKKLKYIISYIFANIPEKATNVLNCFFKITEKQIIRIMISYISNSNPEEAVQMY